MAAINDMLHKLNPWHKDDPIPPTATPPLSPGKAYLLISLYALLYFIPFYLSPLTRPSPTLSRDAPSVIRARVRSVTISTLICLITSYFIISHHNSSSSSSSSSSFNPFHLLGFYPISLSSTFKPVLLTALLFLGPLYSYFVIDGGYQAWFLSPLQPLRESFADWQSYRNYIIVSP
ncbi:hypothetical protein QBC43DRAFT_370748, partial [Cladorrhinum sp. PSN259]